MATPLAVSQPMHAHDRDALPAGPEWVRPTPKKLSNCIPGGIGWLDTRPSVVP